MWMRLCVFGWMKWKVADSAWLTALKSRIGQVTSESFKKPDQEGRFAMDHPAYHQRLVAPP